MSSNGPRFPWFEGGQNPRLDIHKLFRTADTEERDTDLTAMMRRSEIGPSLHVSCCLDFGDYIHPNPAGYKAMPNLISLSDLGEQNI